MNSPIEVFTGATELSAQEEVALASSIAAGDTAALHKLVESNIGLVVTIAEICRQGPHRRRLDRRGYARPHPRSAYVKPGNGSRFCTYASYWITQTITQALFESHLIQIPGAHATGPQTLEGCPARANGNSRPRRDRRRSRCVARLESAQERNIRAALTARSLTLLSTIPAEGPDDFQLLVHDPAPEAENRSGERFDELRGRLRALDQHEKVVVALRYGFNGKPPKSNREIAAMLNMHRETVRLILTRRRRSSALGVQQLQTGTPGKEPRAKARTGAVPEPAPRTGNPVRGARRDDWPPPHGDKRLASRRQNRDSGTRAPIAAARPAF